MSPYLRRGAGEDKKRGASVGLGAEPRRREQPQGSPGRDLARPRKAKRRGRPNGPRVNTTGHESASHSGTT